MSLSVGWMPSLAEANDFAADGAHRGVGDSFARLTTMPVEEMQKVPDEQIAVDQITAEGPTGVSIEQAVVSWSQGESPEGPVLVLLHGDGQDEQSLVPIARPIAGSLGLAWATLRGPIPTEDGHGWLPAGAAERPRKDDVEAAVATVQAWCTENLPAESSRLVIGFAHGGVVAGHLLRTQPQEWVAAALLASFVMPGKAPGDQQVRAEKRSVLLARGADDQTMPADVCARTEKWVRQNAMPTEHVYPRQGHRIGADMVMDLAQWVAEVTDTLETKG